MRTSIILAMTAACLLSASCSKKAEAPRPFFPLRPSSIMEEGGEDDDHPILMHKALRIDYSPITGATVSLVNSGDTLTKLSDGTGQSIFSLPRRGIWNISVTHPEYEAIYDEIDVEDSVTERTDYMIAH